MRRTVLTLLLTAAVVLATVLVGWPAPAVVGAFAGRLADRGLPPRDAARAAAFGWGVLLVWSALRGTPASVVGLVAGLAGAHGARAYAVTLAAAVVTLGFAAVLAWAAATCVAALYAFGRRRMGGGRSRAREGRDASFAGPAGAGAASAPERVTLSGTADVAPARDPERAPAAQTP